MIKLVPIYNEIKLINRITPEMVIDLIQNKNIYYQAGKLIDKMKGSPCYDYSKYIYNLNEKELKNFYKELLKISNNLNEDGGVGEQYATPKAFGKKKRKKYSNSGYTEVDPKQRFKAKTFDVVNWKSNKPKYFK